MAGLLLGSLGWPTPLPARPAQASDSSSAKKASTAKTSRSKATPGKSKRTVAKRHHRLSPRVQRMHQAFVASASLKPMAQQLLQERTPAAYAGVTAYAQRHAREDAGALAWLALGYAHILDHDYAKAIDPLNRARAHAGDLGDYVAYYLGSSYLQPGRSAVALLEKDRIPLRADVELGLGRAYAASGQPTRAAAALRNVYYRMPTSSEADTAGQELRKLSGVPPATLADRRARADLLAKGKRYADAASEYRDLLDE